MKYVDIDFETRSEVDITLYGAHVYACHPSTEILMVSYSLDMKKVTNWNPYTSKSDSPRQMLARVKRGAMIRAFNSEFEYWIWNKVGVRQFGWPEVDISQFSDVMARSAAMAMPVNLAGAAEAVGASVLKQKEGRALISFFSKPSRKKGEEFKEPLEHPEKFAQFISYCDDDVYAQIGVVEATEPLSKEEEEIFHLTERMNVRGIPIDTGMVASALDMVTRFKEGANIEAQELAGENCGFETLNQNAAINAWLNQNGCGIPNMQKGTITEWLSGDKGPISDTARRILELRSQYAKTSVAKYVKLAAQSSVDGQIHGFLKYHIARTGRWGGRGVQPQNLPRAPKGLSKVNWDKTAKMITRGRYDALQKKHGCIMDLLSGALRASLKAPEGYKFVASDYSQVEARLVMWCANDPQGIADFEGDGKVYEAMASTIFNMPKEEVGKDSFERFMGKSAILGAGFGMGIAKFILSCKAVAQTDISEELGRSAIQGYRKRYAQVPKLWKSSEKAAISAVETKGVRFHAERVSYIMRGRHLYCKLPSGRELCYPYAAMVEERSQFNGDTVLKLSYKGVDALTRKWVRISTWGGKLVENFVQACARDIMAHGLKTCEANGYPTVLTVHDEGVALVKADFGSHEEYTELMCQLPSWILDCPIVGEGWEGNRYQK